MEDYSVDSAGRLKGERIVKKVIYGSTARLFRPEERKNVPAQHTHEWKLYLKPFDNEDMSSYVKKVIIKLHDTYSPNNIVTLTRCPYEVSHTGWGEFEAVITVYWHDASEKTITLTHYIRLHKTPVEIDLENSTTKPRDSKLLQFFSIANGQLVSEHLDEFVFCDPSAAMRDMLCNTVPLQSSPYFHSRKSYPEVEEITAAVMEGGIEKARNEVAELRALIGETRSIKARLATLRDQARIDAGIAPPTVLLDKS